MPKPVRCLMQDKVNISVAIVPMARDFGWSPTTSGLVQSSFFWGYMLTQIPGGYVTSRIGGRKILPGGVALWSAATAAVPFAAGTLPGMSLLSISLPQPAIPGNCPRSLLVMHGHVCFAVALSCRSCKAMLSLSSIAELA